MKKINELLSQLVELNSALLMLMFNTDEKTENFFNQKTENIIKEISK
jgi:hypothetical protein